MKSARDAFIRGLPSSITNPTGKGSRLIIVHIGLDTGFVHRGLHVFKAQKSVDHHAEITGEVFHDCFKGKYEHLINKNCFISE